MLHATKVKNVVLFITSYLNIAAMKHIYIEGDYLQHNPDWHERDSPWKAKQIQKIINRNTLALNTIAEIGCGVGEILNVLQKNLPENIKYSGFDISPTAIEKAKQKANTNLQFYLEDLTTSNKFFDLLLVIDVVEHIEDYYGFLDKLKNKAKYKIFHFPLDLSAQTVMRGTPLTYRRKTVGHIHFFTKDTALEALQDKGYKIIDNFYTASATDLNASLNPKSLIMQLPRRILYGLNKDFAVRLLGGYSLLVLAE
jgi:SAM-dependent methyltransferase